MTNRKGSSTLEISKITSTMVMDPLSSIMEPGTEANGSKAKSKAEGKSAQIKTQSTLDTSRTTNGMGKGSIKIAKDFLMMDSTNTAKDMAEVSSNSVMVTNLKDSLKTIYRQAANTHFQMVMFTMESSIKEVL